MVRVICWGDTHQNIKGQNKIMDREDYDIALCIGDIEHFRSSPKPLYYIGGNHDLDYYPEILDCISKGHIKLDNFTYLKTGRVYIESGMRIGGLSGNYAPTDYDKKRKDLTHPRHFTLKEVETCAKLYNLDFFISHESPYGVADVCGKRRHCGVKPVLDILDSIRPSFFISGHIHRQQMDSYLDTCVINIGYGVKEEFVIIDLEKKEVEFYRNGKKETLPIGIEFKAESWLDRE